MAEKEIRTEQVQFDRGATSKVIEEAIQGYDIVDYVLNARAGQLMNVSMASDNTANYFNVIASGTDVAIFNSSASGNHFEQTLPKSGNYNVSGSI